MSDVSHRRSPARGTREAYDAPSTLARFVERTKRPRRMIAACVASASPSSRLCVTSSSAAPCCAAFASASVSAALPDLVETRVRLVAEEQHAARARSRARSTRAAAARGSARAPARRRDRARASLAARASRPRAGSGRPYSTRRELDVLARRERRVEHARVRDESHARPRARAAVSAERHATHEARSPPRREQAGEQPQQRRLARAVRPEQRETIAAVASEKPRRPPRAARRRRARAPPPGRRRSSALLWLRRIGEHPLKDTAPLRRLRGRMPDSHTYPDIPRQRRAVSGRGSRSRYPRPSSRARTACR